MAQSSGFKNQEFPKPDSAWNFAFGFGFLPSVDDVPSNSDNRWKVRGMRSSGFRNTPPPPSTHTCDCPQKGQSATTTHATVKQSRRGAELGINLVPSHHSPRVPDQGPKPFHGQFLPTATGSGVASEGLLATISLSATNAQFLKSKTNVCESVRYSCYYPGWLIGGMHVGSEQNRKRRKKNYYWSHPPLHG